MDLIKISQYSTWYYSFYNQVTDMGKKAKIIYIKRIGRTQYSGRGTTINNVTIPELKHSTP